MRPEVKPWSRDCPASASSPLRYTPDETRSRTNQCGEPRSGSSRFCRSTGRNRSRSTRPTILPTIRACSLGSVSQLNCPGCVPVLLLVCRDFHCGRIQLGSIAYIPLWHQTGSPPAKCWHARGRHAARKVAGSGRRKRDAENRSSTRTDCHHRAHKRGQDRYLVGHVFDEKLLLVVAARLLGVPSQLALAVDPEAPRPACPRQHLGRLFTDGFGQRAAGGHGGTRAAAPQPLPRAARPALPPAISWYNGQRSSWSLPVNPSSAFMST